MSIAQPKSTLQRVSARAAWQHPGLAGIFDYLAQPATEALLREHEVGRRLPEDVVARLFDLGLGDILAGAAQGQDSASSYGHSFALLERLAAASGSLGIIVGVNVLALGAVCMGAAPALRERICEELRQGEQCSLVLSEWDHGSDLRGTQTRAEPGRLSEGGAFVPTSGAEAPTHYRITGTKDLINGGGSNTWLITLVSVEGGDGARGLSLLAVRRDETVSVTRQWTTLPTPAADIASVRFSGTVVAADHVVGRIGSGHRLVMHRLARSRGGISALAAGTTAQAVKLTDDYLHHREIHGRPLWAYPALIGHIHRLEAIDLAVACLCAKTELVMSSPELEPAYMTAVAKLSCCQWAERAVDEGRQLMSARALLEQSPYTRLVRDVLLFSIFDGSRHVILAQLSKYVGQLIAPADEPADVLLRSALEGPPIGWREASLPRLARPTVPDLGQHLDWLADKAGQCKPVSVALSRVAHLVKAQIAEWVASGCWKDQTVAFGASQAVADLEMGAALLGFGHAPCRAALGLPAVTQDGHDDARVDTAASMLGMAAAEGLLRLQPEAAASLVPIMGVLAQVQSAALAANLGTYPRR